MAFCHLPAFLSSAQPGATGLAARPVLSNLFAGVPLAMTQPIRIDDSMMVENEYCVGPIEHFDGAALKFANDSADKRRAS